MDDLLINKKKKIFKMKNLFLSYLFSSKNTYNYFRIRSQKLKLLHEQTLKDSLFSLQVLPNFDYSTPALLMQIYMVYYQDLDLIRTILKKTIILIKKNFKGNIYAYVMHYLHQIHPLEQKQQKKKIK